jgi:hypothetical protein
MIMWTWRWRFRWTTWWWERKSTNGITNDSQVWSCCLIIFVVGKGSASANERGAGLKLKLARKRRIPPRFAEPAGKKLTRSATVAIVECVFVIATSDVNVQTGQDTVKNARVVITSA